MLTWTELDKPYMQNRIPSFYSLPGENKHLCLSLSLGIKIPKGTFDPNRSSFSFYFQEPLRSLYLTRLVSVLSVCHGRASDEIPAAKSKWEDQKIAKTIIVYPENVKKISYTLKNNTNIRSLRSAAISLCFFFCHFCFRSQTTINPVHQLPLSLFFIQTALSGLEGCELLFATGKLWIIFQTSLTYQWQVELNFGTPSFWFFYCPPCEMGSSGESNTNGIDASVGGLVWVRRRNGSWWPGRIMGLDELSESCLVSPRSGTPVKLLGREDASVDWYNLEKSKRVKAFRCGEYNECIERAKVSAANSNKKAVKYARREDAILHALELESARLGKEPLNFCSRTDKSGSEHGVSGGESPVMSHSGDDNDDVTDDISDSEDNSNSAPELSQSGISFEENHNGSSKMQSVQGRRRRTPNDSEDDGTEGVKRMRGLEDLGIGVVSKRKVQGSATTDIVQQDSASLSNSNSRNCLANGTSVNGGKVYSSSLKRKRSQVANVHEFLKRKNRRRPLTKVLESTAMVSVPVICDQLPNPTSSPLCGISDGRISGLDSNGSKKCFPLETHNSDGTGVACENGTALNVHEHGCDASQTSHRVKESETSGMSGLVGNDSSDKLFDVPFVGDLGEEKHTPGFPPIIVSCSSAKAQVGALGQQSCHGSQSEALPLISEEGQNESGCMSSAAGQNNIGHRAEKGSSKWQLKGKRNLRHKSKNRRQVSRKYMDIDGEPSAYLAGIENLDGLSQGAGLIGAPTSSYRCPSQLNCTPVAEGQLDGFRDLAKHIRGTTEAKLFPDGSLMPQRSLPYRQSRYAVNSRYKMVDFPGRNYCSDASLYDVKIEVKASYRPQHVPLVSLMSKLNGKAIVGHPLTVEPLDDGQCNEVLSGIGSDLAVGDSYCAFKPNSVTARIPSKNLSSPSKSSKMKKSGLLNKKIRKLSSLTGHRQSEEERKPVVDKFKGPVIACIPLKVVFSRINEAVNGQARPTHRALPTANP